MSPVIPVIPAISVEPNLKSRKSLAGIGLAAMAFMLLASPAQAQLAGTTTSTNPETVLSTMVTGLGPLDDAAGLAAAVGMGSTIFAGGALIVKRFLYA